MIKTESLEQLVRDTIENGIPLLGETDHGDPQRLTAGDVGLIVAPFRRLIANLVRPKNKRIDELENVLRKCLKKIRQGNPHYCPHGATLGSCHDCAMLQPPPETDPAGPPETGVEEMRKQFDAELVDPLGDRALGIKPPTRCPHGEPIGDCHACNVEGDLAFDRDREDRTFRR